MEMPLAHTPLKTIEAEISHTIALKLLHVLIRIPRTEWRNNIIPFPVIYQKAGYVLKLDRATTKKALMLLAAQHDIKIVKFHGARLNHNTESV